MKKILLVSLVVLLLSVALIAVVAADEDPQGDCPPNWHLHMLSDHNHGDHGDHHHIDNDSDHNGDGYICGKHVGNGGKNHVHIDNNVPFKD